MTNIPEDKMLDINEESSAQLAHPVLCPKKISARNYVLLKHQ